MPALHPTAASSAAIAEVPLPAIAQSPLLQAALVGLDVSLDEELERYRRWQTNGQTISYTGMFRTLTDEPETTAVAAPSLPPLAAPPRSVASAPAKPPAVAAAIASDLPIERSDRLGVPQASDGVPIALKTVAAAPPGAPSAMATDVTPSDAGALAHGEGQLLHDIAADFADPEVEVGTYRPAPDSLRPMPAPDAKNPFFTPLGLFSFLLLLLSSAVVGYLIVDPSGLTKLIDPGAAQKKDDASSLPEKAPIDLNASKDFDPSSLLADPRSTDLTPFSALPNAGDRPSALATPPAASSLPVTPPLASTESGRPLALPPLSAPSTSRTFAEVPPVSLAPPPVVTRAPARSSSRASASSSSYSAYEPPARSYEPPAEPIRVSTPPKTQSAKIEAREPVAVEPSRTAVVDRSRSSATALPPPPAPSAVPPSSAPVALRSSSGSSVQFAPPVSAVQPPTPEAYAPPVAAASPPASTSYRVTVPGGYVAQARQLQADAFVRPADGKLQMGAYRDAEMARQRAEELRRQGIPANIETQ